MLVDDDLNPWQWATLMEMAPTNGVIDRKVQRQESNQIKSGRSLPLQDVNGNHVNVWEQLTFPSRRVLLLQWI
jgi:hypothetical protein